MMAEENPFVGGHEVAAVVMALAGSGTRVIKRENFGGNESGIEPVRHQIAAHCSHNEPRSVEWFAAMQRDGAERAGTQSCNNNPADDAEDAFHLAGFAGMLDLMNCAMSALSLAS